MPHEARTFDQINTLIYTLRKQNPLQKGICKGLFVVDRGIEPLCQD